MMRRLPTLRQIIASSLVVSFVGITGPIGDRSEAAVPPIGIGGVPRAKAPVPKSLWHHASGTIGAESIDASPDSVRRRAISPVERAGIRWTISGHQTKYVLPKDAPLDPRAMGHVPAAPGAPAPRAHQSQGSAAESSGVRISSFGQGRLHDQSPSASKIAKPTRDVVNLGAGNYSAYTGFNHWWTFEEDAIPGVGRYFANIGTGQNLIVQADDMDIHHKGIDLAFRRTYNSQSLHDVNNDDGSDSPGQFGNGWTNTFDAHLAANSAGGISVYDVDGARYDYLSNGSGGWQAPPGVHDQLTFDGGAGYYWTKTSGTVYHFWEPSGFPACNLIGLPTPCAAYMGRIYQIFGRNQNTNITFTYSWAGGNAGTSSNLTEITAATESGLTATLTFASFNGNTLLSKLTWPNGTVVGYLYDSSGDLIEVDEPINSSPGQFCHVVNPCLAQQYEYVGAHLLNAVLSPRWVGSNGNAGQYVQFSYFGWNGFEEADYIGYANPTINDGYSSGPIQGSNYPSTAYLNHSARFDYVTTAPSGSPVTWEWHDSDLHQTQYTFNLSTGAVIERQSYTGSTNLVTTEGWDANNNLLFTTDARGNETDYAYDQNGNATVVLEPQISPYSGSAYRPTAYYSYDSNFNVLAYCDQLWSSANGKNLTNIPNTPTSASLCPTAGSASYTYSTSATTPYEPFGELLTATTPLGFVKTFQYSPSAQTGTDYGLPTAVIDQTFTQTDGTNSTPTQLFSYDIQGNLISYNKGNGAWALAYDSVNRRVSVADPDGPTTCTWYFPDGKVGAQETPAERASIASTQCSPSVAADSSAKTYTYDNDGNEATETTHHGCVPGTTCTPGTTQKWYDGRGRLVEVSQPHDSTDFYTTPWITRYLYDLTQGAGSLSYQGSTFQAYGNLYETQELLPGYTATWSETQKTALGTPSYLPTKADAFDALDRKVTHFEDVLAGESGNSSPAAVVSHTFVYDTSSTLGLLSSECNEVAQCKAYTYDAREAMSRISFSGTSAATQRSYYYDPDGRTTVVAWPGIGNAQQYTFDADGRLSTSIEPSSISLGFSSHATLSYTYYPTGKRKWLSVSSSGLTANPLIAYSYRPDQAVQTEAVTGGGANFTVNPSYTSAGRFAQRAESGSLVTTRNGAIQSYDQFGRPTTATFPGGTVTLNGFDYEGSPTSGVDSDTLYASYTVRGENRHSIWGCSGKGGCLTSIFADGVPIVPLVSNPAGGIFSSSTTFDTARSGVLSVSPPTTNCTTPPCVFPTASNNYYDNAHRMFSAIGSSFNGGLPGYVYSRTYDTEDHITSEIYSGQNNGIGPCQDTNMAYVWGLNLHPMKIGGITRSQGSKECTLQTSQTVISYDSLHWDGDSLLFTTNSSGALDDLKLDSTADYLPGTSPSVIFSDRVYDGTSFACHTATSAYTLSWPAYMSTACISNGGGGSTVGTGQLVSVPRPEGYSDGYVAIQGTRVYDPTLGSFTTPDAFAGSVHDPMSQKPYVWNRNNPVEYSDPSGFCVEDACVGEGILMTLAIRFGGAALLSRVAPAGAAFIARFTQSVAMRAPGAIGPASRLVTITNSKLANITKSLFRPTDTTPGGTAGKLIEETIAGGSQDHLIKAQESLTGLNSLIRSGQLSTEEQAFAQGLANDLSAAIKFATQAR